MEPVIDNRVIGYDGGYVVIEDEAGRQYRLWCGDPERHFPVGICVDAATLELAERTGEA